MLDFEWTDEIRRRISAGVSVKYDRVAVSPEGLFNYPTGRTGLQALDYEPTWIEQLAESVAAAYCGVGNPFSLGVVESGQTVLDVGCGAGVDAILAAMMVGSTGRSVGVDMVPAMVARANKNLAQTNCENVSFYEASAEALPFTDRCFDVVISNGVFNLVPDKPRALAEVLRVLKPGGRLLLADQVSIGSEPKDPQARIASWSR